MEAPPLRELLPGEAAVLLAVPAEHVGRVLDADAPAVGLDHGRGVVEEVVCVDDADLHSFFGRSVDAVHTIGAVHLLDTLDVGVETTRGDVRSDKAHLAHVLKDPADLVVAGLGGVEIVEARHLVQRRDGAAVVRGDAVVRIADQEGEVEPGQHLQRHDGRVARLGLGVVGVRLRLVVGAVSVDTAGMVAPVDVPRADSAFDPLQGGGDAGGLAVRGNEVVDDVFDEDGLSLLEVSMMDSEYVQ